MSDLFQLHARGIRKSFGGVEVLKGVDLDAAGGDVLALLGENGAGKSTLVKILAGDYEADEGTIEIAGERHATLDPTAARQRGIRMIFQELAAAPDLTVAENVMLGQWPSRRGIVQWGALRRSARAILDEMGVDLDLSAPVSSLRVAERQVIEIARALVGDARCLILDEPTAALSHQEVERLFAFIGRLRENGVAIVYITHRLDELERVADRVQVLRDGATALEGPIASYTRDELVTAMVGKAVESVRRPEPLEREAGPVQLEFASASSEPAFSGLDLSIREGEVVALYGKIGSGTAEVAEVAFGIRRLTGGTLAVGPSRATVGSPADAIRAGVGYLPADRQHDGAFMVLSVAKNLCAPSWGKLAHAGSFITSSIENEAYRRWHDVLGVRSRNDPDQLIATLSGGNQQKVLLGRWLELGSRVLVLVEPTRGVDVGARSEIYRLIRSLAAEGTAVLVVTSDYEEVVQVADRALVMSRGAVSARLDGAGVTVEQLASAAGE